MRTLLIAILLSALSVSADEKAYTRWIVVAYFDGIDKPAIAVAKPTKSATECHDNIELERKRLRIPSNIVVGCEKKEYNMGVKS